MVDYKTKKQKKIDEWWKSGLGDCLLSQEHELLQSLSKHFYGYYQVQLTVSKKLLPSTTRDCKQIRMDALADIDGEVEALPFKLNSIDTLLLPHVLSFSADPHQVLREAERILAEDGTLVLCSFNPWSLWGLRRLFSWQDKPPWTGSFISLSRVKDWLALLNFETISVKGMMFRPPLASTKWMDKLSSMEQWGRRLWPLFSGVHIIVARKRTIPLTPVNYRWRSVRLFPSGKMAIKPVTREGIDG